MKRYILVDDLIKELNQTYQGSMIELCMSPLGVENWLNERAKYPVRLQLFHKDQLDPKLNDIIQCLGIIYRARKNHLPKGHWEPDCLENAVRYLEQLKMLKGEYARVFCEDQDYIVES